MQMMGAEEEDKKTLSRNKSCNNLKFHMNKRWYEGGGESKQVEMFTWIVQETAALCPAVAAAARQGLCISTQRCGCAYYVQLCIHWKISNAI